MTAQNNRTVFAQNLQRYVANSHKSQAEICEDLGIKPTTFSDWMRGINYPRIDKIEMLATYFGIPKSDLIEEPRAQHEPKESTPSNIFKISKKKIPLLGTIAAGVPIYAEENHASYMECGNEVQADFCLRIQGDSMTGARIYDGDVVFIRQQPTVEDGQIAAVLIGDEATLKRVYFNTDGIMLVAENPTYKPIIIPANSYEDIRILGKAVAFQSYVK